MAELIPSTIRPGRQRLRTVMTWGMGTTAAAALGLLIAQRGFYHPPARPGYLEAGQLIAIAVFVCCKVALAFLAISPWAYVRQRWFDFALVGLVLLCIVLDMLPIGLGRVETWTHLGVVNVAVLQIYILIEVGAGALRAKLLATQAGMPPVRLLVLGLAMLILLGTAVLMLPVATTRPTHHYATLGHVGKHLLNCLFTSTSAVCVTGLVVYDTGTEFTRFGQWVILAMIQLGGLGIMIFGTIFAMLTGRHLSLRHSLAFQDTVSPETLGHVARTVWFVVTTTLLVEGVGAIMLYPMWPVDLIGGDRWFYSIFHSVSAFCNAGFALQTDSLARFRDHWQIFGTFMPLIIIGGLGFPVLQNLWQVGSQRLKRGIFGRRYVSGSRRVRLSLQSKLVLSATAILLVLPAGAFALLERPRQPAGPRGIHAAEIQQSWDRNSDTVRQMPGFWERFGTSAFLSVTARTAGFSTCDLESGSISNASQFLLIVLMWIGGSPASTAGGVKTVTITLLVLSVIATLRSREHVEAFSRTVAVEFIQRAGTLAVLYSCLVGAATLALCITEEARFSELLFEAVSACGTVGLSTGITHGLSEAGRAAVILAMFTGRVGPLTLLIALTLRRRRGDWEYPAEQVIIG